MIKSVTVIKRKYKGYNVKCYTNDLIDNFQNLNFWSVPLKELTIFNWLKPVSYSENILKFCRSLKHLMKILDDNTLT